MRNFFPYQFNSYEVAEFFLFNLGENRNGQCEYGTFQYFVPYNTGKKTLARGPVYAWGPICC